MANFPATLPAPSIEGYSINPDKSFIRTEMDTGPARQRQIFTAVPTMVQLGWRFTAEQMADFREFFKTDIHQGTDWFQMELDIGDGRVTYGTRFTEPWQASFLPGGHWSVSGRIEVRFE